MERSSRRFCPVRAESGNLARWRYFIFFSTVKLQANQAILLGLVTYKCWRQGLLVSTLLYETITQQSIRPACELQDDGSVTGADSLLHEVSVPAPAVFVHSKRGASI